MVIVHQEVLGAVSELLILVEVGYTAHRISSGRRCGIA